jgi:hypothetical protein
MKKTGISAFVLVLMFLAFNLVKAQPTVNFVAPFLTVTPGQIFSAPVRVAGFNRIVGVQYSMNWNPSVLRFDGITNPALNMSVMDNFGLALSASGVLSFSWYDQTVNGQTIADSTILFNIRFEAIGSSISTSPLTFGSQPTSIEVVDTSLSPILGGYHNGLITIANPNAVEEPAEPFRIRIGEPQPNPFDAETTISVFLDSPASLKWVLYDASGRELLQREQVFGSGQQFITIHKDLLSNLTGNLYCKIYLPGGEVISKKIIKM